VQAFRPAPTASATAASTSPRLVGRCPGEEEIGMPTILPYGPTASDTDRHQFDTHGQRFDSYRYKSAFCITRFGTTRTSPNFFSR
jgi:hypothetical protein